MDRRSFTRFALSGLALSFLPDSAGRAASLGILPSSSFLPKPTPDAFALSNKPYARLIERAKAAMDQHGRHFQHRDKIAIADFNQPSREPRFHLVDLTNGWSSSFLVAHGRGSDPSHSGWLQRFSNEPNSLASCAGTFKTSELYYGQHGQALRLIGLDPRNSNAEPRAIVVHGADYVSEAHVASWGKCGRSEGCFALARHVLPHVLDVLGTGRMIYADKIDAA